MGHGVAPRPVACPAPSSPDVVWVTPPRDAPSFNATTASCLMSVFFYGRAEKLYSSEHEPLVFSVPTATPALAQAIIAAGVPSGASVKLALHVSLGDARLAARAIPPTAPPVITARRSRVGWRSLSARRRPIPPSSLLPPLLPLTTNGTVPDGDPRTGRMPAPRPPMSTSEGAPRCLRRTRPRALMTPLLLASPSHPLPRAPSSKPS